MRSPLLLCLLPSLLLAASPYPEKTPDTLGNRLIDRYFAEQTREITADNGLAQITTAADWEAKAPEYRRQLFEMLGLDPLPEKTPLNATKTGEFKGDGYIVEKMHFQSMPGLYVTANLYLPEKMDKPLPTILYVCGHAVVVKDGVSLGNKAGYEHHGVWYARHGYACMIIDTVQLGEIRGEHHGTYSKGRWWWFSRGYTPAGLEAWSCIRALDYLETRKEVDKTRFGVTGRSGGGAYSWWITALDERIQASAPTAGVTDMQNQVIDGCVEGHCDCMFFVNTYRWNFERMVALAAPRPLLIVNTDKDSIFPIDGVFRIYQNVRKLYSLLGKEGNIGLQVAEGPHKDLQPLNMGAFHWFERFLKGADTMAVIDGAKKTIEPASLRVFTAGLPKDEINTKADETFVPMAKAPSPATNTADWSKQSDTWMQDLKNKVFNGWPKDIASVNPQKESSAEVDGIRMTAYDFDSQSPFRLRLYVVHRDGLRAEDLDLVALNVLDEPGWDEFCATYHSRFGKLIEVFPGAPKDDAAFEQEKKMFTNFKWGMAYICPRGVGPTAWTGSAKAQTQRLRRFYLLGQTLDGMRVWDIRRTLQTIRAIPGFGETPLWIQAHRDMAVDALYASLFEDNIKRLDLHDLPLTHNGTVAVAGDPQAVGPAMLNVLKYLDIPQATAMAAMRSKVVVYAPDKSAWDYPATLTKNLGKETQFQVRVPVKPEEAKEEPKKKKEEPKK
ncbi:alpha/beta hydrolase family protein [Prosthecobacter sp.]|uniref:alpha/beta hydrolase family protein n=1 Tax=Prosthecobacter sp. TaxID=1965333 RepID=UPI00378437F7